MQLKPSALTNAQFDQYTRQLIAKRIIETYRRIPSKKFKILDIGGDGGITQAFFPQDTVTILDVYRRSYKGYVKGDARNMPFKDGAFDFALSFDVYEHIKDDRRKYLEEAVRVASRATIIAAPFSDATVNQSELKLSKYYSFVKGKQHAWLKEHIDYGLPKISQIENFIRSKNLKYKMYATNNLELWKLMQYVIFLQDAIKSIPTQVGALNKFYNKNIDSIGDSIEPTYRKVVVISKNDLRRLENNKITSSNADVTIRAELLDRIFRAMYAITASHKKEISLAVRSRDVQIQAILNSRGWRTIQIIRKLADNIRRIRRGR